MKKLFRRLLAWLHSQRRRDKIMYIGGSDTLPPPLPREEETEVIARLEQGDPQARQTLIERNLRLVVYLARRFENTGIGMEDLISIGTIGLMKSIDAFDLSYDVRLSSYSLPMIIGEIRRYLRDNSPLRVSRSVRDTAYRVLQAREKLLARQQREPTVEQIARELGIRREEVVFAMDAMADPVSLYEPLYDSGGDALRIMDQIGDENSTDSCWLQQLALKDAIAGLTPRQRDILALRYSEGKTQMEVSREIGISQAQVSRLEKGAIGEIKKNL